MSCLRDEGVKIGSIASQGLCSGTLDNVRKRSKSGMARKAQMKDISPGKKRRRLWILPKLEPLFMLRFNERLRVPEKETRRNRNGTR